MSCRLVSTERTLALTLSGLLLAVALSDGVVLGQEAGQKPAQSASPTAETVLRRTADYCRNARSISLDLVRIQKMGPQTVRLASSFAFQRPNKFALRTKGAAGGIDVVSDGKKLYVSLGPLRKHTEADAPASLDDLAGNPIVQGMLQFTLLPDLCAADPYQKLMEGVSKASYLGLVELDGAKSHHLRFTQDQFDWELWVAADGDPLIRRVVIDLTKSLGQLSRCKSVQESEGWNWPKTSRTGRSIRMLTRRRSPSSLPRDRKRSAASWRPLAGAEARNPLLPCLPSQPRT